MWYGVSSIAARFINYLLNSYPYLFYVVISTANYGQMSAVYAAIPLFNTQFLLTEMETAYFRFMRKDADQDAVINTATISLLISSVIVNYFVMV